MVSPNVNGSPTTFVGAITLATAPDPGPTTPRIATLDSSLLAGTPGLVRVQFDPTRPVANEILLGSYALSATSIVVDDDGVGDDAVAGDGYFSGRLQILHAGSYAMVFQPEATDGVLRAFYPATIIVR